MAPQPGSAAVARKTREHRGPGRGHDGTVDTPAAQSKAPEDRDIHRAKSPTPAPETFTRAESTPPPLTPSHTATTSPAPTPSVPHDTTNSHPPQEIAAGDRGMSAPQMREYGPHAQPRTTQQTSTPDADCPPKWEPPSRASVTGLFLSNENTIRPAIDLLALVLREASGDR